MTKENSRIVRCRFAPSPTGYLHLGGARTALFNYLFARRHHGAFILRIEDTDQQRSTPEATQAIFDGLNWLKLTPDEGPFFQSERNDLYRAYAAKLLESGNAYRCSCSSAELDAMREAQRLTNQKPQYNRKHRPVSVEPQSIQLPTKNDTDPFVIRLRAPLEGETSFSDLILGQVTTRNEELDDFVIIRSDGTPTYNFTVVVDDIDMKISHVIRGMDHVSNTPKQLLIYHALGVTPPEFAHLPMILGADKKKLSKRHGATSVIEYKKDGYLSDAFVNYLARLGWSHGDQEIFTRQELERFFNLDSVGKSAAVFDFEKLLWVNAEHLKTASTATLIDDLAELLPKGAVDISRLRVDAAFLKLIDSLRARAKTLKDIAEGCHWYLSDDTQFRVAEDAAAQHLTESAKKSLGHLLPLLQALPNFDEIEIESAFKQAAAELDAKLVAVAQPARVALTGGTVSPPINVVVHVLGRDRATRRLRQAIGQHA